MIPLSSKLFGSKRVLQTSIDYVVRNIHKVPIRVGWEKPEMGWTKLNFDGSSKFKTGKASIGGVFRNHKAEFLMGFAESIGKGDSTTAEFLALRRGLELTLENGWNNVWLEGDCLSLLKIIERKKQVKCAQMQSHLGHINLMLPQVFNCKLSHVYREGNRVAHELAQMGHNLKRFETWHEIPPEEIVRIVQEDAQGKTFFRKR